MECSLAACRLSFGSVFFLFCFLPWAGEARLGAGLEAFFVVTGVRRRRRREGGKRREARANE